MDRSIYAWRTHKPVDFDAFFRAPSSFSTCNNRSVGEFSLFVSPDFAAVTVTAMEAGGTDLSSCSVCPVVDDNASVDRPAGARDPDSEAVKACTSANLPRMRLRPG